MIPLHQRSFNFVVAVVETELFIQMYVRLGHSIFQDETRILEFVLILFLSSQIHLNGVIQVREQIETKLKQKFSVFQAVEYIVQIVAGKNYIVKV